VRWRAGFITPLRCTNSGAPPRPGFQTTRPCATTRRATSAAWESGGGTQMAGPGVRAQRRRAESEARRTGRPGPQNAVTVDRERVGKPRAKPFQTVTARISPPGALVDRVAAPQGRDCKRASGKMFQPEVRSSVQLRTGRAAFRPLQPAPTRGCSLASNPADPEAA